MDMDAVQGRGGASPELFPAMPQPEGLVVGGGMLTPGEMEVFEQFQQFLDRPLELDEGLEPEQYEQCLTLMEKFYTLPAGTHAQVAMAHIEWVQRQFPQLLDPQATLDKAKALACQISTLKLYMESATLMIGEQGKLYEATLMACIQMLASAHNSTKHIAVTANATRDSIAANTAAEFNLVWEQVFNTDPHDVDEDNPAPKPTASAQLARYYLEEFAHHNYMRYKGGVYKRCLASTSEGVVIKSMALARVGDIKQTIYNHTTRELTPTIWNMLMSSPTDMASALSKKLQFMSDSLFPDITTKVFPTCFSYRNCIVYFSNPEKKIEIRYYNDPDYAPYPGRYAVYHIDQDFPDVRGIGELEFAWDDGEPNTRMQFDMNDSTSYNFEHLNEQLFPTPTFDRIFLYQGFESYLIFFIYALIGRVIGGYRLGERDRWQVILQIIGAAQCGKSTLLEVLGSYFPPEDVGLLSADMEADFGMGAIRNKLVWFMYEASEKTRLTRTQYNSLAAGDPLYMAIKYMDPECAVITAPGIIAGNVVPNTGMASADSTTRRGMNVYMPREVSSDEVDQNMKESLMKERGAYQLKAVLCYMQLIDLVGSKSIWEFAPDYVINFQEIAMRQSNPVYKFIKSDHVLLGDEYSCTMHMFREAFYEFHSGIRSHYRAVEWKPELYQPTFTKLKLRVERVTSSTRGISFERILGCGVVSPEDVAMNMEGMNTGVRMTRTQHRRTGSVGGSAVGEYTRSGGGGGGDRVPPTGIPAPQQYYTNNQAAAAAAFNPQTDMM